MLEPFGGHPREAPRDALGALVQGVDHAPRPLEILPGRLRLVGAGPRAGQHAGRGPRSDTTRRV